MSFLYGVVTLLGTDKRSEPEPVCCTFQSTAAVTILPYAQSCCARVFVFIEGGRRSEYTPLPPFLSGPCVARCCVSGTDPLQSRGIVALKWILQAVDGTGHGRSDEGPVMKVGCDAVQRPRLLPS